MQSIRFKTPASAKIKANQLTKLGRIIRWYVFCLRIPPNTYFVDMYLKIKIDRS